MSSSPPRNVSPPSSSFYSQLNASMRRLGRSRTDVSEPSPPLPGAAKTQIKRGLKKYLSSKQLRSPSAAPMSPKRSLGRHAGAQASSESFFCRDSISPPASPPPLPVRPRSPSLPPSIARRPRPSQAEDRAPAIPTRETSRPAEASPWGTLAALPTHWEQGQPARLRLHTPPKPRQSHAATSSLSSGRNTSHSSRLLDSTDTSGSHRPAPFARFTLRGYAQRCVLQDLGLRLYGPASSSHDRVCIDRQGAVDVLLAAAWRAFLESSCAPMGASASRREQLERSYREARLQVELAARAYGMGRSEARALAERAQEGWRDLTSPADSMTVERHEPWQLANAPRRPHSVRESKDALVRICCSDRVVGPYRVAYILGTTLRLGEHLRSINDVPEHELAADDQDFVALVRSLWKSPETELLLYVYQAQVRALSEPKDKEF